MQIYYSILFILLEKKWEIFFSSTHTISYEVFDMFFVKCMFQITERKFLQDGE